MDVLENMRREAAPFPHVYGTLDGVTGAQRLTLPLAAHNATPRGRAAFTFQSTGPFWPAVETITSPYQFSTGPN